MSVNEFISCLFKYKKQLAVFVALSMLLCMAYINMNQSYTAEVFIKYLDDNAVNGLTSNNTELNPYEISDAIVVKKALESIGVGSTNYDSFRKNITITPLISASEQAKYASYIDNFSDYENTEANKSHPVYFSVKFTTGISPKFARNFLDALVGQYRIYYVEKYAHNDDMALISEKAIMEFDYLETSDILEKKLRNNISYLNNIVSSDFDFRSTQTGYSMSDLVAEYEYVLQNDLADVSQYIIENGISKNTDVLSKTLMSRADNAVLESNMNAEKASTQMELSQIYSNKNQEYTGNITEFDDEYQIHSDTERDFVYDTDKSVYDQLVLNYVGYCIKSNDLLMDKDMYMRKAEKFSKESVQDSQVEQSLSMICTKYNTIQQLTEETLCDYNNFKSARYLTCVSGIATSENISGIIYYTSSLVLSIGFFVIVIVFLELKRKKKI